ncbi:UbiA prenyltransferase family [Suillus paluster]|uniref:UbiA prenyltransferase family n=1 Tax=Suillus paluster TaxID=48578 RepID=UPI001B8842C8|nr:UbiA prenyltransferase family [Suillus paluster]KAG1722542.1 UbiA prenyltransferase family [Suillus paluster]
MALSIPPRSAMRYLQILYFFTRDDITTTIIPITLFAVVAGPLSNFQRCFHIVFWIWLHLLHFNVANQIIDPQEDGKNKSSRPIPAGLISLEDAVVLRWALIPICLATSAYYSSQVFGLSFLLTLFILFYNELKAHEHWISKSFITAVGYACFEIGSTLIAGKDMSRLEPNAISAIVLSLAVFASTLHAQDFKDVEGDRLIGRKTLPIAFPNLARMSMMIALPLWSICLSRVWGVNALCTFAFTAYAAIVGLRFMTCNTSQAARMSCKLYSLWFSVAHLLPAYWRYFHEAQAYVL